MVNIFDFKYRVIIGGFFIYSKEKYKQTKMEYFRSEMNMALPLSKANNYPDFKPWYSGLFDN